MAPALRAARLSLPRPDDNPAPGSGPFLFAERIEDPARPTVFGYGHGDVIRGLDAAWRTGLVAVGACTEKASRYYGRGVVDNKGQHTINLAALAAVIAERGRLGFNAKWLIETGEETGSPGLRECVPAPQDAARGRRADRLRRPAARPRPADDLAWHARRVHSTSGSTLREGGHHSGNWGGLLANPGDPCSRTRSRRSPDRRGRSAFPNGCPTNPDSVRARARRLRGEGRPGRIRRSTRPGPSRSARPAEHVFGWWSVRGSCVSSGVPDRPVNAVPPKAGRACQLRYVVGIDPADFVPALRRHLDRHGFPMVQIAPARDDVMMATRQRCAKRASRSRRSSRTPGPAAPPCPERTRWGKCLR